MTLLDSNPCPNTYLPQNTMGNNTSFFYDLLCFIHVILLNTYVTLCGESKVQASTFAFLVPIFTNTYCWSTLLWTVFRTQFFFFGQESRVKSDLFFTYLGHGKLCFDIAWEHLMKTQRKCFTLSFLHDFSCIYSYCDVELEIEMTPRHLSKFFWKREFRILIKCL